ncbi:hypothetical protein [Sphingomonas sp.]
MLLSAAFLIGLQSAVAPTASKADDAEKMICKRSKVTGSLVRKQRDCRTKAQWAAIADAAREDGENMRAFRGADRYN